MEEKMKTEFHSVKTELDTADWPVDPRVLAYAMGMHLYSFESMSWGRNENTDDLTSITIYFNECQPDALVSEYEKKKKKLISLMNGE
jgi:hypothetical protein